MQHILVTGGAGYIGSVVTHHLLCTGYQVRVLDSLRSGGNGIRGFFVHHDFTFHKGDIRNKADVVSALANIDCVIHLAAIVGEPACDKEPQLAESINSDGSALLLEAAHAAGVKRFIFASTCSNYGKMKATDGWVDETTPLEPLSLYAKTKVGFEEQLLRAKQSGMTPVILRFATAYGMSFRPRFDLTVNEFAATLATDRHLDVYGEQFWRPYCHVVDIAEACRLAIETDAALVSGRAFNVGSTAENYQKKGLIALLLKLMPEKEKLVRHIERDHDPRDCRVNCDLIRNQLGFAPTQKVAYGIQEIVKAIASGVITDFTAPEFRNV